MICEIPIDDLSVAPELSSQPVKIKKRMLVIDDDRTQADVLAHRFSRANFHVVTAHTGRDGLRQAQTGKFDVVLLDINLPDLDGWSVCETLTDDASTCATPVILVSGIDDGDVVRRVRAAGGAYFVRKPYDPNVLLMVVNQAVGDQD